ncbi:MAG: fibronectin type III domain-containing protein [Bacteroidia bacterium]
MSTSLTTYFYAVMHCSPLQKKKLQTLLNKVIAGRTANATLFPLVEPAIGLLTAEVTPFADAIANAKGGGLTDTAVCNKESLKVHGLLKQGLPGVNKVADGDKDTILLSGYDASKEKEPAAIPNEPVIEKIKEGPIHGSLKIFLAKVTSTLLQKHVKRTLIVEMKLHSADESEFKIVLFTGSKFKLIIPNLTKGVEVDIRVSAMNAKGTSKHSNVVSYTPQTGAAPLPTPTPTPTPGGGTPPPTA